MDEKLALAHEAFTAAMDGGATPASAVCAAALVLDVDPPDALNMLVHAGLVRGFQAVRTDRKNAEVIMFER